MQASYRDRVEQPMFQRLISQNEFLPHMAFILGVYFLCIAFVGFAGDFELDDAWIYAQMVQHYLTTGTIELAGSYATCYLTTLVGAAACKLMGFSHETLRCLSLFWG